MNLGAIALVAIATAVAPVLFFIFVKYAIKLTCISIGKACKGIGKMFSKTGGMVVKTIRGERV
ncbi:MAG: hypothetical protein IJ419_08020 [Agathobacter sp.]|nr:hypothetical protein [Agathobacter sp.]